MGSLLPAMDDRIKVVALHPAGFSRSGTLPEVDQINFAPRRQATSPDVERPLRLLLSGSCLPGTYV